MSLFHRKALAGIGVTAAAIASTALFSSPAQAASAGLAKVVGTNAVQFNALLGKSNALVITISGRTVTLDDKVALQPGAGCKKVDSTKVKCTTKKAVAKLSVALGDLNDSVVNKTGVYMLADGGTGNDVLSGGSGKDQLQGGAGNDKLNGNNGNDIFFGGAGNDIIHGNNGNDYVEAQGGADVVYGDAGNDELYGDSENDKIYGGAGNDKIGGDAGNDQLFGEAGNDQIEGNAGNDTVSGGDGNDKALGGGAGNDTLYGGAGDDDLYGDAGDDVISGAAGTDDIAAGTGNDTVYGGDGTDYVIGEAGNDRINGEGGDDYLAGESLATGGTQVGSDAALDVIDGGANVTTTTGDACWIMAAGTASNCETVISTAPTSAGTAALATAKARFSKLSSRSASPASTR